jgi:hypothetical protein
LDLPDLRSALDELLLVDSSLRHFIFLAGWGAAEGAVDYRMYYGSAQSGSYEGGYVALGNVTQYDVDWLLANTTYWLMLRSVDSMDVESEDSLELEVLNGEVQPRFAVRRADYLWLGDSGTYQ